MFECSKCGICCQHIDMVPELAKYDIGNGRCQYLTKNNLCAIYEDRPSICSVDKMYEKYFAKIMSKEAFYKKNLEGCKELKKYIKNCK